MNVDKNVYLLGAGFSKELGLPLQDDFLLVAKEVYFKDTLMFSHFDTVFEYQNNLSKMKQFLSYPLLNLEQLFNLIEMDIFYSKDPEKEKIKDNFVKLICDVLVDRTPSPFKHNGPGPVKTDDIYSNYLSFISLLIKDDKHGLVMHDDTIISLNYDLVVEGAACVYNWMKEERKHFRQVTGIQFNTMFGKGNIEVDSVDKYFCKNRPDSFFPDMALFSEEENAVKLIKLHGSINWKRTSNKTTFIVPPTWNKSDLEIRKLWEIAFEEVKAAKRIIFIGYSFPETDVYIKSLLTLALNENKIIQNIYFINPDADVAKKTCLSLLDKHFEKYCAYKDWTFSFFIRNVIGKSFIRNNLNREVTL